MSAAQVNGEVQGLGRRHRPGHRPRGSRADLRGVPADRDRGRAARGDRPRPRALEAVRRAARRPDLGRERARPGKHVRVHAARGVDVAMAGERILVVEDNEKNMKLFRDVLHGDGLPHARGDDRRARRSTLATEHAPDLVLMDIQLPDIDGVEALGRLRADERTASIPVLALTAQAMHGDRERFLAAGFDGYLSKPVNVGELVGTVRQHCDGGGAMSDDGSRRSSSSTTCPQNVRLLEAVLDAARLRRRLGHATARARSSSSRRRSPDLVLLDVVMPRAGRLRGLPPAPRARGDGGAAGDHGHGEHRPGEDEGDRGRRGRLHPEAVRPRRAARARPVAAPDQALPRHDQAQAAELPS